MKRNARQMIIDAFMTRVEQSSLSQVRIADIIQELGMNRNTFYYHFSSKYDVALQIFQDDLAAELEETFDADDLLYLEPRAGSARQKHVPYYARVERGAHDLDVSDFMKALAQCLINRRSFYRKLFNRREQEFLDCVADRYRPVVRSDIEFVLGRRYMPEETIAFLTEMGTGTLLQIAIYFAHVDTEVDMFDERINPFWNYFHDALSLEIQRHPMNRYRAPGSE